MPDRRSAKSGITTVRDGTVVPMPSRKAPRSPISTSSVLVGPGMASSSHVMGRWTSRSASSATATWLAKPAPSRSLKLMRPVGPKPEKVKLKAAGAVVPGSPSASSVTVPPTMRRPTSEPRETSKFRAGDVWMRAVMLAAVSSVRRNNGVGVERSSASPRVME